MKKSEDTICYLISLSSIESGKLNFAYPNISVTGLPTVLKIDSSVVDYLKPKDKSKRNLEKAFTKEDIDTFYSLSIEFVPFELKEHSVR
jgi:hypothetical protein